METEIKPEVAKIIVRLALSMREITALLLDSQDARVEELSAIIADTLRLSGLHEGDYLDPVGLETR